MEVNLSAPKTVTENRRVNSLQYISRAETWKHCMPPCFSPPKLYYLPPPLNRDSVGTIYGHWNLSKSQKWNTYAFISMYHSPSSVFMTNVTPDGKKKHSKNTEPGRFVTETTPFVTEMIPFVMDRKLRRVDSESGKYNSSPGLVLVQYVTSSST